MKIRNLILLLFAIILVSKLTSCSSSLPEGQKSFQKPTQKVLENFLRKYPNAGNITWSANERYQRAQFYLDLTPATSLYNNITEEWVFTEVMSDYNDLPKDVKNSINDNLLLVSDITTVQILSQPLLNDFYIVNFKNGSSYSFSSSGAINSQYDAMVTTMPNDAIRYISANYPLSIVVSIYKNAASTVVIIADENRLKTLLFGIDNLWLRTYWNIAVGLLPAAAQSTLENDYADYTIYKCEYILISGSSFYQVTLMKEGSVGLNLKFDGV